MSTNKVTIEFAKPKNHPFPLISWIIKAIEGTNFSHVVIRIDAGINREFVYHSHMTGLNFLSKKLYNKRYQTVEKYEFQITKDQRKKLITWFLDKAGESYPMLELIGMLFVRFWERLFKKQIRNPLGTTKMYCSEAAIRALKIIGIKLPRAEYKVNALREIREIMSKATQ